LAKRTIADQLVAGLIAKGWVEGKKTTHYRRFQHTGLATHVFVGTAGALRVSRTGKVTQTGVANPNFREAVLAAGNTLAASNTEKQ
jgi:hypothetical protein